MADHTTQQALRDGLSELRQTLSRHFASQLIANPHLGESLDHMLRSLEATAQQQVQTGAAAPPDGGLGELVGIGPKRATDLGTTFQPPTFRAYDEEVNTTRLDALADLYYIYQHERLGMFRAVKRLKELHTAGAVRLAEGEGAVQLYQFDRREVLRYTRQDRMMAYRRAFGYGNTEAAPGARPNMEFHPLFTNFINQVALFWRDKRVADVMRERVNDPSFGSIAIVRRSGLDLRNNLKFVSYGHINALRIELLQVLDEAYRILDAEDVKRLFGADNAWDTLEEILTRYNNERLVTSPRQRMAVTGRSVLNWLSQPLLLVNDRAQFEAHLISIAEEAEEWITSAESLGLTQRAARPGAHAWDMGRSAGGNGTAGGVNARRGGPPRGTVRPGGPGRPVPGGRAR